MKLKEFLKLLFEKLNIKMLEIYVKLKILMILKMFVFIKNENKLKLSFEIFKLKKIKYY